MRTWDDDTGGGVRAGADLDDDMHARERLKEAFGLLHAPAVTYERTCKMAQSNGERARGGWTRRVTVRTAVVGAAAAMLLASGAYAAASSDFFVSAFGDKGQENVAAHEVVDEEKRLEGVDPVPWTAPATEWVAADPAEAERIVGEALATVGESVTRDGTTLTVESCAVDENGLGVVTFVLENPQGVSIGDAGYGQFYLDPQGPLVDVGVVGQGGGAYDWRCVLDKGLSTEAEVHGVLYFGPFDMAVGAEKTPEPLRFALVGTDDGGVAAAAATIDFAPGATMGAAGFSADGLRASVSPVGIVFEGDVVEDDWMERLTVHLADGSDYVVVDDDVMNAVVGWYAGEHTTAEMFNRLVDPAEVTSVEVELTRDGEVLELLPVA